jgi:hypothetical protein
MENDPMPDLNLLLDNLVADVSTGTQPPGARGAIKQARRRRWTVAIAAGIAVSVIAAGSGLAAANLGGNGRLAPAEGPTLASPQPPTVSEGAEAEPGSDAFFRTKVEESLADVPGWAVSDNDPTILHPCGGNWSAGAGGGSGGNITFYDSAGPRSVWAENVGFSSAAQASDAAARLVANLNSCPDLAWRTQPIAQSGTVLASSMLGVVWIHQRGAGVAMLEVPTADGPPPLDVQIEIADLVWSSIDRGQ